MDGAGLLSSISSSSIILDTTAPETNMEISGVEGDNGWYTSGLSIVLTTDDEDADIHFIRDDQPVERYRSVIYFLNNGDHSLRYWSEDPAGNKEPEGLVEFRIDKECPECSYLSIDHDAEYTTSRDVTLTLTSSDGFSGCSLVSLRSDNEDWGPWLDICPTMNYHLEGVEGVKYVEARVRDAAGNVQESTIKDSIILDLTSPGLLDSLPARDQTGVALDSWIVVNFTEAVLLDPMEGEAISVFDSRGQMIGGDVDFWNLSTIASFKPTEPLEPFEVYEVVLNPALTDEAGNPLSADNTFNFSTEGIPPPGVEEVFVYLLDAGATVSWSQKDNPLKIPIDGYRVYRTEGEHTAVIFEGGPDSSSCLDASIESGGSYVYTVVSFNIHGESGRSPGVSLDVPELPGDEPPGEEPLDDDEEPPIEDEAADRGSGNLIVLLSLVALSVIALAAGVSLLLYLRIRKEKASDPSRDDGPGAAGAIDMSGDNTGEPPSS